MSFARYSAVAILFACSAGAASAADPAAPVRVLFDIATGKAAGEIFDDKRLKDVFSQSFADTYRIALKVTDMAGMQEGLFDYDPLVGGQDGCELKVLSLKALEPVKQGDSAYTPVEVTFDNMSCFEGYENKPPRVEQFKVVLENGKYVVDDYNNGETDETGKPFSLKQQLVRSVTGDITQVAGLTKQAE